MPEDPQFEVALEDHRAWTLIHVRGELDMATAPELEAAGATIENKVAVDLSGVTFIDSSGLRALVRIRESHDHTALVAPSPVVRRLLSLTRMEDAFRTLESPDTLDEPG